MAFPKGGFPKKAGATVTAMKTAHKKGGVRKPLDPYDAVSTNASGQAPAFAKHKGKVAAAGKAHQAHLTKHGGQKGHIVKP